MIDLKVKENKKLEKFIKMRDEGLQCSEKMLSEDIKNFIAFFQQNSEQSNNANKDADYQSTISQDKTKTLKEI
jgi:RIO-like serine/threonine protein kinase